MGAPGVVLGAAVASAPTGGWDSAGCCGATSGTSGVRRPGRLGGRRPERAREPVPGVLERLRELLHGIGTVGPFLDGTELALVVFELRPHAVDVAVGLAQVLLWHSVVGQLQAPRFQALQLALGIRHGLPAQRRGASPVSRNPPRSLSLARIPGPSPVPAEVPGRVSRREPHLGDAGTGRS